MALVLPILTAGLLLGLKPVSTAPDAGLARGPEHDGSSPTAIELSPRCRQVRELTRGRNVLLLPPAPDSKPRARAAVLPVPAGATASYPVERSPPEQRHDDVLDAIAYELSHGDLARARKRLDEAHDAKLNPGFVLREERIYACKVWNRPWLPPARLPDEEIAAGRARDDASLRATLKDLQSMRDTCREALSQSPGAFTPIDIDAIVDEIACVPEHRDRFLIAVEAWRRWRAEEPPTPDEDE